MDEADLLGDRVAIIDKGKLYLLFYTIENAVEVHCILKICTILDTKLQFKWKQQKILQN